MSGTTIVVAAAADDERWRDRVIAHIDALATQRGYRVWDDRRIEGGDDRLAAVERAIEQAQVVIALVSSSYLAAREGEPGALPLEVALARRYGRHVVPLIVRPCPWSRVEWVQRAEVRPRGRDALSALSESAIETALSDLAEEIDDRLRAAERPPTAAQPAQQPRRRGVPTVGAAATLLLGAAVAGAAWLWRATPEPIPCPRPAGRLYEAEAAQLSGSAAFDTEHRGYSGAGFVSGYGVSLSGTATSFTVDMPSVGTYTLSLCYANAAGTRRALSLYVNDHPPRRLFLTPAARWDTWQLATETVVLHAGSNTIAYRKDPGDSGAVNLDFIVVKSVGPP